MHRSLRKLLDPLSLALPCDAQGVMTQKAHTCARILAEAHRLVRTGQFGSPLHQAVCRACELLDDMDEVLVSLHPDRHGAEFATAAALHRELEQIQAAIPASYRGSASTPKAGPEHS